VSLSFECGYIFLLKFCTVRFVYVSCLQLASLSTGFLVRWPVANICKSEGLKYTCQTNDERYSEIVRELRHCSAHATANCASGLRPYNNNLEPILSSTTVNKIPIEIQTYSITSVKPTVKPAAAIITRRTTHRFTWLSAGLAGTWVVTCLSSDNW
jgi:hypothetical protein